MREWESLPHTHTHTHTHTKLLPLGVLIQFRSCSFQRKKHLDWSFSRCSTMGPTTVCIAVETQSAARTRPLWLLPLLAPPPWSPPAALAAILPNDSPGRSNWTSTGPPVNSAKGFNVDVRLIWGKPRWWDETSAEAFRREANLSSAPVGALM